MFSGANPFAALEKELVVGGASYKYFDIASFGEEFGMCLALYHLPIVSKTCEENNIVFFQINYRFPFVYCLSLPFAIVTISMCRKKTSKAYWIGVC